MVTQSPIELFVPRVMTGDVLSCFYSMAIETSLSRGPIRTVSG